MRFWLPAPLPCLLQSPYHCNLMLAGYDAATGPVLYWMDYLATLNKVNTGGTGYGEERGRVAGWVGGWGSAFCQQGKGGSIVG